MNTRRNFIKSSLALPLIPSNLTAPLVTSFTERENFLIGVINLLETYHLNIYHEGNKTPVFMDGFYKDSIIWVGIPDCNVHPHTFNLYECMKDSVVYFSNYFHIKHIKSLIKSKNGDFYKFSAYNREETISSDYLSLTTPKDLLDYLCS